MRMDESAFESVHCGMPHCLSIRYHYSMDNRRRITEKIMLNHDKMCLANNGPRTVAKAMKVKAESESGMKRYAASVAKIQLVQQ